MKIQICGDSWPWQWMTDNGASNGRTAEESYFYRQIKKNYPETVLSAMPACGPEEICNQIKPDFDVYIIFLTDPVRDIRATANIHWDADRYHTALATVFGRMSDREFIEYKKHHWTVYKARLRSITVNKPVILLGGCQPVFGNYAEFKYVLPNIKNFILKQKLLPDLGMDYGWTQHVQLEKFKPSLIDLIDKTIQQHEQHWPTAIKNKKTCKWHLEDHHLGTVANWCLEKLEEIHNEMDQKEIQ